MARRDESVPLADAGLDDLFESSEALPPSRPGRRPWLFATVVLTLAVSAVAVLLARAAGFDPSTALVTAIVGGLVVVRLAAARVSEPAWRRTRDLVAPPRPRPRPTSADDAMVAAVDAWDRRLDRSRPSARRAAAQLFADLGDVVDERLRQQHGLTRASDPDRARRLLGEAVWAALSQEPRPLSPAEVAAVVARLETLASARPTVRPEGTDW